MVSGEDYPIDLTQCLNEEHGYNIVTPFDVQGLGIVKGTVKRFSTEVKVPQMGWNSIHNLKGELFEGIRDGAYMYLVHSYFVPNSTETVANANYDGSYSVALQKDNFYGVQFHPEKSSKAGSRLLQNFLAL